ncbi:MAG: hypothetical protein HY591_04075, partial [Candidatus Omnitrophica bacterium]|nr:hypothetical protein [Candidatus Omnitrophota bacterium]
MKKRVVYFGFDDKHQKIIDYLYRRHGWEPVFFCCPEKMRTYAKERYPGAVFQDEMEIRRACFDYSRIAPPVPVDAKIIEALSKYESNCLNLLEDTTGWNFSFAERLQYYYDLLKYWNTLIHRLKPDLFLETMWPHTVTSYTLYLLCKHFYSIDVLFVDPMPLLNGHFHVIGNSLEDLSTPFRQSYESDVAFEMGPAGREYLAWL